MGLYSIIQEHMANYTILQKEDIQKIIHFYGLTIYSFEAIEGGAANSSYLLKASRGDFVLTVYNSKDWSEVIKLEKLLNYLAENKFFTTKLIPRIDGTYVSKFQEIPVLIKRYIKGKVYKNLTNTMLRRTGEKLARLHEIPPLEYLPRRHSYGWQLFPQVIGKGIDLGYESWLADQHKYIKDHLSQKLPRGLIHGDLFYDNMLFQGNELQALIDFEEVCNYFLGFDIGMGIVGQCLDGVSVSLEKAKDFVSGYQRVRKLEKVEIENLQFFTEYAATATSYWRFWNYNIFIPTPDKQRSHRKMMQISENVSAIHPTDFQEAIFGSP